MNMIESTLCYIEKDNKYLMLHRIKKKNDVNHDKWIGIGGRMEPGESPETCIRRETLEETGLTLLDPAYRGIVDFYSDKYPSERMHLFTATEFSGEMITCDEGDLEWIGKSDLLNLPIWEGDKIFLRLLDSDEPFFNLTLQYTDESLTGAELNGVRLQLSKEAQS